MKRLELVPDGEVCTFKNCRPGFFLFGERLFLKGSSSTGEAPVFSDEGFYMSPGCFRDWPQIQPVTVKWMDD